MQKNQASIDIPQVGVLFIRNGLAAIKFESSLLKRAQKPLPNSKQGVLAPQMENKIKNFERMTKIQDKEPNFFEVDQQTIDYISK